MTKNHKSFHLESYILLFSLAIILIAPLKAYIPDIFIYALFSLIVLGIGLSFSVKDHVDHLKLLRRSLKWKSSSTQIFTIYGMYFSLLSLFVLLWVWQPFWALAIFLLFLGYQFGESQLIVFLKSASVINKVVFTACGIFILSWFIHFHSDLAGSFFLIIPGISNQSVHYFLEFMPLLCLMSGIVLSLFFILEMLYRPEIRAALAKQILYFSAILVAIAFLPPYLAILSYFGFWHSFRIMDTGQLTFQQSKMIKRGRNFPNSFVPLALLSLIGIFLLSYHLWNNLAEGSFILIFIIIISLFTLPHNFFVKSMYRLVAK